MENEIWKDIPGYEGRYKASNLGKIKSFKKFYKTIILKDRKHPNGYFYAILCINGIRKTHKAHRLVAKTHIPNPENKPCINHKNGIKTDNRIENLEWCTYKENNRHAVITGLCIPHKGNVLGMGIDHPVSKPVAQYTMNDLFVNAYGCMKEVERIHGYPDVSIGRCCHRFSKQSHGYKWKFITKEEYYKFKEDE